MTVGIMREARGLSRQQVAHGLGLPLDTVTEFELGGPLPSAAELRIMCRWYDMQVCDVFRHPGHGLALLRHVCRPIGQPSRILTTAGATVEGVREAHDQSTPYRRN